MATPPKRGPEDDNWGKLASDLFGINFGVDDELDLPDPDAPDFAPAEPVEVSVIESSDTAVPAVKAATPLVEAEDDLFAAFEDEPQPVAVKPSARTVKPKTEPAKAEQPATKAVSNPEPEDDLSFEEPEAEPADSDRLTVAEQQDEFWDPLADWNWEEKQSTETGSRQPAGRGSDDRSSRDGDSRGGRGRGRSGGRGRDDGRRPTRSEPEVVDAEFGRPEPIASDDVVTERPRRPARDDDSEGGSRPPRREGAPARRDSGEAHSSGSRSNDERPRRHERGEGRPRTEGAGRGEAASRLEGASRDDGGRPPRREDRRDRPPRREPVSEVRRTIDEPQDDLGDDFATGLDSADRGEAPRSRQPRPERTAEPRRPVAKQPPADDFFDEELLDDSAVDDDDVDDESFGEGVSGAKPAGTADEDRPRRRRRRRRGGRSRFAEEAGAPAEDRFNDEDRDDDRAQDDDTLDEAEASDIDDREPEAEDPPQSQSSSGRRRPQRGRHRGQRDSRFEVVEHSMLPDVEPRQVPEYDDEEDDGEAEVPRVSYEEIPSWEEAISLLARVTGPDRHRGRGDGRRDGRRGDGRRGDGNRDYR